MKQIFFNILDSKKTTIVLSVIAIIVWTVILPISCSKAPTLTQTIVTSINEHPKDWVQIDRQEVYDEQIKTDTAFNYTMNPLIIMGDGVKNVYMSGQVYYNKNCNMALFLTSGIYNSIKVTSQKNVVELNSKEVNEVWAAIDEMNENIRLKKEQDILNEICK